MRARSGAVLLVGWLSAISSARRVDVREIDLIPYNHETKDDDAPLVLASNLGAPSSLVSP